jgi:hypothetical protein
MDTLRQTTKEILLDKERSNMAITTLDRKIMNLEAAARYNKKNGNSTLSKWMKESAEYFKKVRTETKRTVDRMLDEMPLGNYPEPKMRNKDKFAHDWYKFEEENLMNWDRN